MANQQEWHGAIRVRTSPENQDKAAAPYLRRGRVLLGLLGGSPRKVEVQQDGAIITVLDRFKGEKLIHVTLPTAVVEPLEFFGTWLSPTSTDAPNGYTGNTALNPEVARRRPWDQPDSDALHSLSFYNSATSTEATQDIRRFRGFNASLGIGDVREFVGSSSNRQGISWDNAPTKHNRHLDGATDNSIDPYFRLDGRSFDLGRVLVVPLTKRPEDGKDDFFVFGNVAGSEHEHPNFHFALLGLHWNCVFYKGKVVPFPDAPFQMSFIPLSVPYLEDTIYNVRIGGAFFRNGKICYIRSLPFVSQREPWPSQIDPPSTRLVDEEIVFVDAAIDNKDLRITSDARPVATASLPTTGELFDDMFTWGDWIFSDDGSEAVSIKYGSSIGTHYWRIQVDWENEVITGGLLIEPSLLALDWSRDGQLLKMMFSIADDPINPVRTFTLPTGAEVICTGIYSGVEYKNLRHDNYVFSDYIRESANTTVANMRHRLYSGGEEALMYDETIDPETGFLDIFGNFTDPVLISENDDGFTLVAVSCQIAPGGAWPTRVYNTNQQLLEWAHMADKPDAALNPILRG